MNLYLISLLDVVAEQAMTHFSNLHIVKSAVYLDNAHQLSFQIKRIVEFYITFFQQLEFLPTDIEFYKRRISGSFLFNDPTIRDVMIREVFAFLPTDLPFDPQRIIPVHVRYNGAEDLFLASGLAQFDNNGNVLLNVTELALPKQRIRLERHNRSYLREVLEHYSPNDRQSLRDFVNEKGYNYNQFQKDCKKYFGDTFYSFLLKKKMIDAVSDILFTNYSFKEISFRNKFTDYAGMYKTFLRYGMKLTEIPRLTLL